MCVCTCACARVCVCVCVCVYVEGGGAVEEGRWRRGGGGGAVEEGRWRRGGGADGRAFVMTSGILYSVMRVQGSILVKATLSQFP